MGRTLRRRKRKQDQIGNSNKLEENNHTIINLKKWLSKNGWKNESKLKVAKFQETGRGLFSIKNIKKGDKIISIPIDLMITVVAIANTDTALLFTGTTGKLTFHELLSAFIVIENHKQIKSIWKSYIDSLPTTVQVPWVYPENDINFLPHSIQHIVHEKHFSLQSSWENVLKSVNSNWKCSCCNKDGPGIITKQSFEWAYTIVNTRSVYIDIHKYINILELKKFWPILIDEPTLALCPFLDMFNHSYSANTSIEIRRNANGVHYELTSLADYLKYEQIFISYGSHDNFKLFCEYGFFLPRNTFDKVELLSQFFFDLKLVKFNRKQYNYVKQKGFLENLFINMNGLSFNLKGLFYVNFNPDSYSWNDVIFNENYSEEDCKRMHMISLTALKVYLKELTFEMDIFDNSKGKISQVLFNMIFEYIKYRVSFVQRVIKKISAE